MPFPFKVLQRFEVHLMLYPTDNILQNVLAKYRRSGKSVSPSLSAGSHFPLLHTAFHGKQSLIKPNSGTRFTAAEKGELGGSAFTNTNTSAQRRNLIKVFPLLHRNLTTSRSYKCGDFFNQGFLCLLFNKTRMCVPTQKTGFQVMHFSRFSERHQASSPNAGAKDPLRWGISDTPLSLGFPTTN